MSNTTTTSNTKTWITPELKKTSIEQITANGRKDHHVDGYHHGNATHS